MLRRFLALLNDLRHSRPGPLALLGAALVIVGAVTTTVGVVGYLGAGEGSTRTPSAAGQDAGGGEDGGESPSSLPPYIEELRGFTAYEPDPDALRLVIERLGVDAPVIKVGLGEGGVPGVPVNGIDVAWYDFSARPGKGSNVVFAGHINWNRAPAVFANLEDLEPGDTIRLVAEDGTEYAYEVFANRLVDPDDPKSLRVMAPTDEETVTLITCGGNWVNDASNPLGGSYDRRTVVQARPA